MDMFNFAGKTVVVTGGASGIGKVTATAFAGSGAKVYVLDLDTFPRWSHKSGGSIFYSRTDVKNLGDVQTAYHTIGRPIDILISNAGIEYNDAGNLLDMPHAMLTHILNVNLMGAINCARTFMRDMPAGGKAVFVSSQQAFNACLPGTSYQASKNALIGVVHALAIELAPKGINVNAICPGGVATEGMGAQRAGDDGSGMKAFKRLNPMGRRAWPAEIAYPILFLCSPWASYINGTTLMVDGGMSVVGMPRGYDTVVDNDPDNP